MKLIEKLAKESCHVHFEDGKFKIDGIPCVCPIFEAGFNEAIKVVTKRIQREASFLSTFPGEDKEYYKLMDTIDLIADVGESEEE